MTKIVIAPTKAEKAEKKEWAKKVDLLASEPTLVHEKGYVSKRNEDMFIGGPLDGHFCSHQPNGPDQDWDPGRHWADYYFKDTMRLANIERKIEGYHIYSSAKAIEMSLMDAGAVKHKDHAKIPRLNLGTRGPNMRKTYFYCGFMETGLLVLDGVVPADFKGVLTLS